MKKIPLLHGLVARVDDEDFERLRQHTWIAWRPSTRLTWYVVSSKRTGGVLLHREVMGCTKGDGKYVDHRDGNGLDNQKKNLRIVTNQENVSNRTRQNSNNTTGFTGVSFSKRARKFEAYIKRFGIKRPLGVFDTAEQAAAAYNVAKQENHVQTA